MNVIKLSENLKTFLTLFFQGVLLLALAGCLAATDTSLNSADGGASAAGCVLNVAISAPCTLSTTGALATTAFGANITTFSNVSATTTVSATIPNGFYSGKVVSFTDLFLVPSNIRSGISIFGVSGTNVSFFSNAFRDKNTLQLSTAGEASAYAGVALPSTGGFVYRDIPKISKDDDGTTGSSINYVNRISWTGLTCGTSGTLAQRITNCAGTLGASASWSSVVNGNAGQGNWKIVTRSGDCTSASPNRACSEVWRDESTQLLWSSKVSEIINWCRASGNNGISGNPATEVDPSNVCDNATYQSIAGLAISACYDDNAVNFNNSHASITNVLGKGGLGKVSTPSVEWRLPSKGDFEQANANGLRYVLPDAGTQILAATSTYEWTSSVQSTVRANAWIFDSYLGYFSTNPRQNTTYSGTNVGVRCIGR